MLLIFCGKFASAQAQAHCTAIVSNVAFGNYTGSTIRVTATLILSCNGLARNSRSASMGSGPRLHGRPIGGIFGGPGPISSTCGLFSDPGYSQNWGTRHGAGWVTREC